MASARTKVAIGAFTLVGIALFTLALLFFSKGSFFQNKTEYVLFFDGSVSGLHVGAPVVFRGVPLGSVTRISLIFDRKTSGITIPVFIQLNEDGIVGFSGEKLPNRIRGRIIKRMISNGLCAQLEIQSLVTGHARISLDYHKSATPRFKLDNAENEIPTVPSRIAKLEESLTQVPIQDLVKTVETILHSLAFALKDGSELQETIASMHKAFESMKTTFATLDDLLKKGPLRASLDETLKNTQAITGTVAGNVTKLFANLEATLANMMQTSERLKRLSVTSEQTFSPTSPLMQDIRRLFREAGEAARSLHNLANMLNRNPEALLKGKQGSR